MILESFFQWLRGGTPKPVTPEPRSTYSISEALADFRTSCPYGTKCVIEVSWSRPDERIFVRIGGPPKPELLVPSKRIADLSAAWSGPGRTWTSDEVLRILLDDWVYGLGIHPERNQK